ncbi:hypothetical protein ACV22V_07665 [Burkholderia sp. AW33-5]
MAPVSINIIVAAVEILGAQECIDDEIENRIRALVRDDTTVRRLVDIIPEAFGLVVASHLPAASGMTLPDTFAVRDESGAWVEVPITHEPVFVAALEIAQHIFHSGPRHVLRNNAARSGILAAVSNALSSGGSLDGATLSGPSFLGLSASLYS